MEWCLECHRNPERFVRPREAVYQMDYRASREPARAGTPARQGVRHQEPDDLFDLSSVSPTRSMSADKTLDLASIRARLSAVRGRQFWRSFEELAETAEFTSFVQREFPQHASEWLDPVGRRGFLKLMGASLALAGASACTRQPDELIVPYVRQPENVVPGRPLFFATAMPLSGSAIGLLAESHEGRPDQDRRQSRSPRQPRRHRRVRAGLRAAAVRSRIGPRPLRSSVKSARGARSCRSSARP